MHLNRELQTGTKTLKQWPGEIYKCRALPEREATLGFDIIQPDELKNKPNIKPCFLHWLLEEDKLKITCLLITWPDVVIS